ncbi:unnamed protein product [Adineta steineri]|uniref:Uncharacterized protein n=1 Tax=Adineta steineri TaxID=433720 RepID=A0A819P8V1_9BILA|nr:unnamed protein product [Adineta steineri]CAF4010486.1 unnamed protein product [Adineta steineri]
MEILTKLIIIFAISAIYVQGEISSTKIKDDAAKMVEIYRKYMMNSPNYTIRDIYRTQCAVISYCCTGLADDTFDILGSHTLEEKCINHPELIFINIFKRFCSDLIESLDEIKKSSEYGRFMKIHSEVPGSDKRIINWQSQMKKACDEAERKSYYCAPDDMKLFQPCQEKILQSLAKENGGKNYDAFLHNWINDFTTFNKRISKEFPKST